MQQYPLILPMRTLGTREERDLLSHPACEGPKGLRILHFLAVVRGLSLNSPVLPHRDYKESPEPGKVKKEESSNFIKLQD